MSTRFDLGLAGVALVAALGACGRAAPDARVPAPDTTVLNASAALVETTDVADRSSATPALEDCGTARARGFIGQPDQPATRTALASTIGKHSVRWIKPGTAVTQDYQPHRLNVIVGDNGRIESVRCG